jgi:DNA-binding transcriptional ArsR family regulator
MRKYDRWAKLLKVLAHPVRLQILEILAEDSQCVCDLTAQLKKRQPYISQQLAVLREAGLVTTVQDGWNIYYFLDRSELVKLAEIVQFLHRFFSMKNEEIPRGVEETVSINPN